MVIIIGQTKLSSKPKIANAKEPLFFVFNAKMLKIKPGIAVKNKNIELNPKAKPSIA